MTYGLGESVIAERIADWENNLPDPSNWLICPAWGGGRLRLSAKGAQLETLKIQVNAQIKKVIPLIQDIYFGTEEDQSIEFLIAEKLNQLGKTLSCAELYRRSHCHKVYRSSGGFYFFKGSAVTYAIDSKTSLLGVESSMIDQYGLVSAPVASSMALGAQKSTSRFCTCHYRKCRTYQGDLGQEVGTVFIDWQRPKE